MPLTKYSAELLRKSMQSNASTKKRCIFLKPVKAGSKPLKISTA